MTLRGRVLGTAALIGTLVVVWLLNESPRLLGELVNVAGAIVLVFFVGRAIWLKWKAQSVKVWSLGLTGCFAVAVTGWLATGIMAAIVRSMGESYAMIIVAPLMLIFMTLAGLAGLAAAVLSIAVIAAALSKPTTNGPLVMLGGAASVVLNIGFIVTMVRSVFR